MNSRDHSDMPPAPSYPSPNAAQLGQGTMQYYSNRQLTEDELLSAELSRDAANSGLADGSSNAVHHGQSMVLGSTGAELGRPSSVDQHHQDHMLQFPPSQQVGVDPNHDLSYGDQSSRRKRSKISRACDECRRKKVRCDATSETAVDGCSNCRRLGVTCQFSRVPMKRGPSKGYIKELAERLHTLESQMHPGMTNSDMANSEMQYHAMGEVSSPRNYQDFSPPADTGPLGRKRTYSVLEGFPSSFTQPPFASRGPQSAFDAPGTSTDTHNATAMQSGAIAGNLFWHTPDEHGLPSGIEVDELKQTMEEDMTPLDVDDAAFNAYVDKIHPFVPILPQSKDRLLEQLHQCSREAQEVFLYALYTVTHTKMDRVANTFEKVQSFGSAQDHLLFYSRNLPLGPSATAQIVLFQTMLLMILDADTRGPDNLTNKDGIPKGTLLQIASTLGYDLARTYGQAHSSQRVTVADPDADSNVVRRCWVSFIILSRWYALSVSDPTFMRYDEVGTFEDKKIHDRGVLAISTFSSFIIDLITIVTEQPNICQSNIGMGRVIGNTLVGAIDRMNTNYSDLLSNISEEEKAKHPYLESLTSQLFWTMRLLIKRHLFVFSPYEVIYNAEKLLDEIYKATIQNRASTPFDYHSLALASMTLLEASVIPEHSEECWEHLKKLDEILDHRSARSSASANGSSEFEDILGTPGWDAKFKLYLEWRRAKAEESQIQELHNRRNSTAAPLMGPNEQRSLQHLADLAVGAEGSVTGNASPPPENQGNATSPRLATAASQPQGRVFVDFTMLTHKGYLNVFSGVAFKRAR